MTKLFKITTYLLGITFAVLASACNDISPEITDLTFDRLFSPLTFEAKVINKTQVALSWKETKDAESYTIEVYADDSLTFAGTPLMTLTGITSAIDTIKTGLIGETRYSVRVKAVGANISESKWTGVFFETDSEQILTAIAETDVKALQVTLRWPAGETASEIVLTTGTSEIKHTVTAAEIALGAATITGLTEDSNYSAKLMMNTKTRGKATFTTLVDLTASGTIVVNNGDDLLTAIQSASDNDRIIIVPTTTTDEFLSGGVIVEITKNLTIRGYSKTIRPIVHAHFRMTSPVSLTVRDLVLDGSTGTATNIDHVLQFSTTGLEYGNYLIKDCVVQNYNKSLVSAASGITSSVTSITFQNCKVSNILTNSADCVDVRSGCVENVTLDNSTFSNCAPARDFLRFDDASAAFAGKTTKITVNRCSFNQVSNLVGKRILYVRFVGNQITFNNSVVANSLGLFTNQPSTSVTFSKNNYFNAAEFLASTIANAQVDASGTSTALDPQFTDAANGNLTIGNTTLLDGKIGAAISW